VIRLKRAYKPPAKSDGRRILVERLWPRGIRKTALAADAWMKQVAPSPELRTWYGHSPSRHRDLSFCGQGRPSQQRLGAPRFSQQARFGHDETAPRQAVLDVGSDVGG